MEDAWNRPTDFRQSKCIRWSQVYSGPPNCTRFGSNDRQSERHNVLRMWVKLDASWVALHVESFVVRITSKRCSLTALTCSSIENMLDGSSFLLPRWRHKQMFDKSIKWPLEKHSSFTEFHDNVISTMLRCTQHILWQSSPSVWLWNLLTRWSSHVISTALLACDQTTAFQLDFRRRSISRVWSPAAGEAPSPPCSVSPVVAPVLWYNGT